MEEKENDDTTLNLKCLDHLGGKIKQKTRESLVFFQNKLH